MSSRRHYTNELTRFSLLLVGDSLTNRGVLSRLKILYFLIAAIQKQIVFFTWSNPRKELNKFKQTACNIIVHSAMRFLRLGFLTLYDEWQMILTDLGVQMGDLFWSQGYFLIHVKGKQVRSPLIHPKVAGRFFLLTWTIDSYWDYWGVQCYCILNWAGLDPITV